MTIVYCDVRCRRSRKESLMKSFIWCASAIALLCIRAPAQADIIFDNSAGMTGITVRSPASSPGALIYSVTTNTVITNIQVLNHLGSAGSVEFLIFDNSNDSLLYNSGPESFAQDGSGQYSWKRSSDFSFTLLAGHQYDIGGIANVDSLWIAGPGYPGHTQSGLSSGADGNVNFTDFASPSITGQTGTADIALRLEDAAPTPEPASATLLGMGVIGVLSYVWLRRKR